MSIITLCGSTKFKEHFEEWNKRLTLQGNTVFSVVWFTHADGHKITEQEKEIFDIMHRKKIDMSDEIFVIDAYGYIGNSTAGEIRYATSKGKPVRFMSSEAGEVDGCTIKPCVNCAAYDDCNCTWYKNRGWCLSYDSIPQSYIQKSHNNIQTIGSYVIVDNKLTQHIYVINADRVYYDQMSIAFPVALKSVYDLKSIKCINEFALRAMVDVVKHDATSAVVKLHGKPCAIYHFIIESEYRG